MDRARDVVRSVGPRDLPAAIQGRTLAESLRKAASYVSGTPSGLPAIWANALARRFAPLVELLRSTADTLSILEEQLQQQIDQHIELLEEHGRLLGGRAVLEDVRGLIADAAEGAETPGGVEHLGDFRRLISKWEKLLAAEIQEVLHGQG